MLAMIALLAMLATGLAQIYEDPVFRKSHRSFFIQLADFCAYALLRSERQLPSKTDYEFRAVLDGLPDYLKDFARFGYLTGWRRSEIASLRWEDVDGNLIRLRGENAKNGESRSITADNRRRGSEAETHSDPPRKLEQSQNKHSKKGRSQSSGPKFMIPLVAGGGFEPPTFAN